MNLFSLELNDALNRLDMMCARSPGINDLFRENDKRPVVVVGSGCSSGVAEMLSCYASHALGLVSKSTTPLCLLRDFSSIQRVIVVSSEGEHPHYIKLAEQLNSSCEVIVITNRVRSKLIDILRTRSMLQKILVSCVVPSQGGYIPIERPLAMLGSIFGREMIYANKDSERRLPILRKEIQIVTDQVRNARSIFVLHDGLATASALDFETRCLESGMAIPTVSDIWNFGHGRFNVATLGVPMIALVFCAGDCSIGASLDRVLAPHMPVIQIKGDGPIVRASISAYIQSIGVVAEIAAIKGCDPAVPTVPVWGTAVYEESSRWL